MKQRTTETLEKLEKTKVKKEENQLCPTGMQWGGHITHPRVNVAYVHVHSKGNYRFIQEISLPQLTDPDYSFLVK